MIAVANPAPNGRRPKRTLPHNLECEASILGGVIVKNAVLAHLDTLEIDDFYDLKHKVVFEAIRNLQARREPIDVSTLDAEIGRLGKSDATGGIAFLGELALRVPTVDNVVAYARVVRDHSLLRKLSFKLGDVIERIYDWEYEADELVADAKRSVEDLETTYREANEELPIITVAGALDELERLARTPVFETPFPALNAGLGFGGLLGGQVYYLAGGTGFGKTSWIATLVKHHAARGNYALVAFYEMFGGYYIARMAAGDLGVHSNAIIRLEVDRARVADAVPRNIELLDSPSIATIRRAAERHVRLGHGAPLIVVDYIQLLGDKIMSTMPRPDARLANAQASAQLRALAKETGSAVLVVSAGSRSMNRKLADDVRKIPPRELVDAARESGAIEYDGAAVIVLSMSSEMDGNEHVSTMTIAKSRFGEPQHIDSRFGGGHGAWREVGRVQIVPKLTPKPDDGQLAEAIARVLKKNGPQTSKTKIWKLTGRNKPAIFSELDEMVRRGDLVMLGTAYALPDHATANDAQGSLRALIDAAEEAGPDPVSDPVSEARS